MIFKVNGERNSGTSFLINILELNNIPVFREKYIKNICHFWKHRIPNKKQKDIDERVIDIFIFRELNSWLQATHFRPYHLKRYYNFEEFLVNKQYSREKKERDNITNKILNHDDNGKTIFEIRYYKFNKIIEYRDNYKDIIFVNLSYLQNKNNCHEFIRTLSDLYNLNLDDDLIIDEIPFHVKTKEKTKNRTYETNIYDYLDIIETRKNNNIENFINELTYKIYY